MRLAAFSVENRVFVTVIYLLALGIGILAAVRAIVDVYPDVSFDQAQILVVWPGASPADVEASVTRRIEEEIEDVRGIDRIVSSSDKDRAIIDVKFSEDLSDAEFHRNFEDLRAAVQQVRDLPEDALRPEVRRITVSELYPTLQVVVTSGLPDRKPVLRETARALRDALRRIEGVQRVSDLGILDLEWKVLASRQGLEGAGMTLLETADLIRLRHRDLPAGALEDGASEVSVRAQGESTAPQRLLELEIARPSPGLSVAVGDVARVERAEEKTSFENRYDGRPCINLSIVKENDAHALRVKQEVLRVIREFEESARLPDDVRITTTIDTTRILENRISILVNNLGFGILLVFVILWLFLGARNAVLAIIGIPFAFLVAYAFLSLFGITINAITLFALVLVSGMVVDDAIVVIENVYRRIGLGEPLKEAVIRGVGEVSWPVVSATLTTCAAFLPLLLTEGVVGEFMSIIPKTVAAVLTASLFECLVLLPAHYMHRGGKKPPSGVVARVNARFDRIGARYASLLARLLRRPWRIVAVNLVLGAVALFVWRGLPVELFPSDFQAFYANIQVDAESGLSATSEATKEVEALVEAELGSRVEAYTTAVGVAFTDDNQVLIKPNVAQLLVYADEEWTKDHDPGEIIRDLRVRADALVARAAPPGFRRIKIDTFQDGPPTGKPVAIRIEYPDYAVGKAIALEIQDRLRAMPGVFSISDNLDEGPRELRFVPDDSRLAESGIPFSEVGRLLLAANEGLEVNESVPAGSDEAVTLRVQLAPEDRARPEDLLALEVRGKDGRPRRLEELGTIREVRGPASLYHYDGRRVVLVTADLDKKVTDSVSVNREIQALFPDLEARYPGLRMAAGGEFEETEKSFASQRRAFVVALLLIFAVLSAQFRSFTTPLVIMCVVPFSYVGVVLGLALLGFPFTIMAFIAIVGLSGVVVNDSIVLVSFVVEAEKGGASRLEAVLGACRTRFRAIFLTTTTTVLGLLPTALGLTGYSKIWSPFAATISFGLALAMFLTLFLIPAVLVLFVRRRPALG